MNGYRFYADLPGTWRDVEGKALPLLTAGAAKEQLRAHAERGGKFNVIALLLGREHVCPDYSQECLAANFGHVDSDVSLTSVSRDYLARCKRIPENLARKLHPKLFDRIDSED